MTCFGASRLCIRSVDLFTALQLKVPLDADAYSRHIHACSACVIRSSLIVNTPKPC